MVTPTSSRRTAQLRFLAVIVAVLVVGAALYLGFQHRAGAGTTPTTPGNTAEQSPVTTTPPATSAPSPTQTTPEPLPTVEPVVEPSSFTIAVAGDVLPHIPVHQSAKVQGGYDFSPLLQGISDSITASALALCHLEVPVAAPGQTPSGYPMFAQSPQIVADLADQGWDGCSTASNHSVDQGFSGLARTIDVLEEQGLGFAGTARTEQEDGPQFYVVTHGEYDTVVAHLSYTQWLNGLPVPAGKPFSVNLTDAQQIIQDASQARELADIVVVSVHDGIEYQTQPSQSQLDLAQALADSGQVDLYVGHHAHVPQPIKKLDGGPADLGMWTAYGLGNMISNQSAATCCGAQTSNGLMMFAQVTRDADAPARVTGVTWRALTVDRTAGHRLEDLSAMAKAGAAHGNLSAQQIADRFALVAAAVGDQAPERVETVPDDYQGVRVVPRGSQP